MSRLRTCGQKSFVHTDQVLDFAIRMPKRKRTNDRPSALVQVVDGGVVKNGSTGHDCDTLLSSLLGGLPTADFKREHWQRSVVKISRPESNGVHTWLIKEFLFGLDLSSMLEATASDEINCWFTDSAGAISSVRVPDPQSALTCHR